jgi:putative transposase
MAEAISHLVRSGCAWRLLPRRIPPWPTVVAHFRRRRREGTLRRMHGRLRALAREAEGRTAEPSAAIIDSQTVRATGVGGPARGYDPAKRTAGRQGEAPATPGRTRRRRNCSARRLRSWPGRAARP